MFRRDFLKKGLLGTLLGGLALTTKAEPETSKEVFKELDKECEQLEQTLIAVDKVNKNSDLYDVYCSPEALEDIKNWSQNCDCYLDNWYNYTVNYPKYDIKITEELIKECRDSMMRDFENRFAMEIFNENDLKYYKPDGLFSNDWMKKPFTFVKGSV